MRKGEQGSLSEDQAEQLPHPLPAQGVSLNPPVHPLRLDGTTADRAGQRLTETQDEGIGDVAGYSLGTAQALQFPPHPQEVCALLPKD